MSSNVDQDDLDLDTLLSCQVCFEWFEENGKHVPRLLPCSHTVCENCIKDLARNDSLKCPECRKKHRAPNKEKSFPQNKYLLVQIRMKTSNSNQKKDVNDRCEKHGRELTLYCLEQKCQKPICVFCLSVDHKKHEVIDMEEKEKEVLKKKIDKMKMDLVAKMETISQVKKDVAEKTDKCWKELKKTKEDFDRCFEKMIKEVEIQRNETNCTANDQLSGMNEELKCLSEIQDNLAGNYGISHERITVYHKEIQRMIDNGKNLCGTKYFQFPVFNTDGLSAEIISERISREEMSMVFPYYDNSKPEDTKNQLLPRRITSTSQLQGNFVPINCYRRNFLNLFL